MYSDDRLHVYKGIYVFMYIYVWSQLCVCYKVLYNCIVANMYLSGVNNRNTMHSLCYSETLVSHIRNVSLFV